MYTMHAKYHIPLDYKVYEFNLEDANNGNPIFKISKELKKDFKMQNFSPSEFSRLSERFF